MSWNTIVNEVAERYGQAFSILRGPADPDAYPREANASRFLAQELDAERGPGNALVECEYWWRYRRRPEGQRRRSIADVWRPPGERPELFAEVKLAGLWDRTRSNIGLKPAAEMLEYWAHDIWYLLALANEKAGTPVEKAFVVVAFGDVSTHPKATSPRDRDPDDADALCASLGQTARPTGAESVEAFFATAADKIGARVVPSDEHHAESVGGDVIGVRCIAAVWEERRAWSSTDYWLEQWTGSGRRWVRRQDDPSS